MNSIDRVEQNGITHAFIMEFETAADRDYYVNEDPVHKEFKELAGKVLEKAQVVDFTDREFQIVIHEIDLYIPPSMTSRRECFGNSANWTDPRTDEDIEVE